MAGASVGGAAGARAEYLGARPFDFSRWETTERAPRLLRLRGAADRRVAIGLGRTAGRQLLLVFVLALARSRSLLVMMTVLALLLMTLLPLLMVLVLVSVL